MKVEEGKIIFEDGDVLGELELTEEQRNELIEENINLVKFVIKKKFLNECHFEYSDLYGYGVIGLVKAGKVYDPNFGIQFSTFAYKKIWGEIMYAIRDCSGMIGNRDERASRTAPVPMAFTYFEDSYASQGKNDGDNGKRSADEIFFVFVVNIENSPYDSVVNEIAIDSVLKLLDKEDKLIFDMYYKGEMSQSAISKELGKSQVCISRRLKKIRQVFKYLRPVLI